MYFLIFYIPKAKKTTIASTSKYLYFKKYFEVIFKVLKYYFKYLEVFAQLKLAGWKIISSLINIPILSFEFVLV